MIEVENIACVNDAGFVMHFDLQYLDPNTGKFVECGPDSGNFPIDQSRSIPLDSSQVPLGASVRPLVHADGGVNNPGDMLVQYAQNGQTATYEVRGTTLDYSVKLIGS